MTIQILLIDDEETQHFIFSNMVQRLSVKASFHCCNSAQAASDYLAMCSLDSFPQIVFVDLKMGDMSGFEFVEIYEKQNYQSQYPQTKLFILTSSIIPQDKKNAEKFTSVSDFLIKPVLLKDLDTLVSKVKLDFTL
ncbi:MAG: response regulator [Verrucomicrobia bacterium]|nr:response regulator [Cytophagales bacterium]